MPTWGTVSRCNAYAQAIAPNFRTLMAENIQYQLRMQVIPIRPTGTRQTGRSCSGHGYEGKDGNP